MSLYSELRDYLQTDASVNALVQIVRMSYAEQTDSRPFVVIDPIVETRPGVNGLNAGGVVSATVDVVCHATTFEECHDIKEVIRLRLDHLAPGYMGAVHIQQCLLNEITFSQPDPRQAQEAGLFVARMSFSIMATESNPEV